MMTPKRPHLLDSLRFFRYGFLLCLVPMVQALFRFDMEGLVIALWQDAAILAVCLALSLALWAAAAGRCVPSGHWVPLEANLCAGQHCRGGN